MVRLFLIDPSGVDVLKQCKPCRQTTGDEKPLMDALEPHVIGASRRPLKSTFTDDQLERDKVFRFFDKDETPRWALEHLRRMPRARDV